MPSPFPGMNPYFEQADHWPDFHTEFLTDFRRQLDPELGPGYIVQLEKHVYIHELTPEPRRSLGRPDASVVRTGTDPVRRPFLGVLEAPVEVQASVEVQLPDYEMERVAFLEIRDRRGRELVTVIELLSPSNKRPGDDRSQYLAKRNEILRSSAHLVEIDLLRGWAPMPAEGRPEGDYSVRVSRAGRRPSAESWPIRMTERLPMIPIPLKPGDPDARVDLQAVLHQAYDGGGYRKYIYSGSPEPAFSPRDAEWASRFVPRPDEAF